MIISWKRASVVPVSLGVILAMALGGAASAAPNTSLSQTITAGTLSTDILDASRAAVASPSVAMSAKNFSFDCQAAGSASSGTFGATGQRLYVTNSNAANNGWTLTVAATAGATATWANGGSTAFMDFNDPSGTTPGCTDGADAGAYAGQMSIDPSVSTLTADCAACTVANVSKGSSSSYNEGTTDSIALLNAAAASDDIWRGYLTGVGVRQSIPAETAAGTYTINLTLTSTAQ